MKKNAIKVEFALVDDITKGFNEVKQLADKWESAAAKINASGRELGEYVSDADSYQKDAYTKFKDVLALSRNLSEMAKQLGVDTPPIAKDVFAYDDLERLVAYQDKAINSIRQKIK